MTRLPICSYASHSALSSPRAYFLYTLLYTATFSSASWGGVLTGKLIYHSYTSYEAGDGELYLLDFADDSLTHLSTWGNVEHTINAHFSPDGSSIVFMGDSDVGAGIDWDIFLWEIGSGSNPVNLTSGTGKREEDPKFSPDGTRIVFKEELADIREMDLSGTITQDITTDGAANEDSIPFYTVDGQRVIYTREDDIYIIDIDGMNNEAAAATAGVREYYSVVRDDNTFLYARWANETNENDQVYLGYFDGSNPENLAFNETGSNYSDPYPYHDQQIFLSSTREGGGGGGYDLYLANMATGDILSLDSIHSGVNTPLDELGVTYFGNPGVPEPGTGLLLMAGGILLRLYLPRTGSHRTGRRQAAQIPLKIRNPSGA